MSNNISPENASPTESKNGRFAAFFSMFRSSASEKNADTLPPSEKARNPFVAVVSGLFSFIFIACLMLGAALFWGKHHLNAPGLLVQDKVVFIPRGNGVSEIARLLEREGVIEHPWVFMIANTLQKTSADLKAGEYLFKASISPSEVIDVLVEGKSILHSITIPEGLTSLQIVARLNENEILTGEIAQILPEGSLLADTHKFARGTTRAQLLARMKQEQSRLVAELWEKRVEGLPLKDIAEFVTLASIVEKETGRADERARVASVFINRLNKRMRLQSDPTIIYGLVGGKATLERSISRADIDSKTAYNTYQIDGLPPGPIANPGRAALEAVARPARTNDIFFVAAPDGTHTFSENYEDHQRAVARLRAFERSQNSVNDAPVPAQTDAIIAPVKDPLADKSYDLTSPKTVPKNMR